MPQMDVFAERQAFAKLMADPQVQAILHDPQYSTPMLKNAAINGYAFNGGPLSNLSAANGLQTQGPRGNGAYRIETDAQGNPTGLKWETLGPQHWYSDPGVIGPIATTVASAGLGGLPGIHGFLPGAANTGYVSGAVNGVENSMYGALGTAGVTGAGAGAAAGAGGAGAGAGGDAAAAGAGSFADLLRNPRTYAGLAGLITSLASKPGGGNGSGSGDVFSQNPQLQHLLDVSSQRVDRTDPLHQAVTQLAMQRLPTNVQR